jgi:hypothetical protein
MVISFFPYFISSDINQFIKLRNTYKIVDLQAAQTRSEGKEQCFARERFFALRRFLMTCPLRESKNHIKLLRDEFFY